MVVDNLKKIKKENILYYAVICLIFIFGIYIRTKLYLACDYFEDDECRLGVVLTGRHFWQIFAPIGPLACTPLFLGLSKIIAELFKYNEYALKFLPFVFSVSGLFLFYKICREFFDRKISICVGLFLLSVNMMDIHFSSIFKTYSMEVLVTMLCLYYFPKIDITKLGRRGLFILTIIIMLLPLISLPSLYFIGLFVLMSLYKIYKSKSSYLPIITILIPLITLLTYYYFVNLAPTKVMQLEAYPALWAKNLNAPLLSTTAIVFRFLNSPNLYTLAPIILSIGSIIYILFNKKEYTEINFYVVFSFVFAILLSYFHLYPLTLGRTAMFLLPVIILLPVKLLDVLNVKNIFLYLTVFLFAISYYKYFTVEYYKTINDVLPAFRNYSPKVLMEGLKSRFNENTDKVITTESSLYSYMFYGIKQGFPCERLDYPSAELKNNKAEVYEYLNSLNPDKNYYFYLIKEYESEPIRQYMQDWLKGQQVEYYKKERNSYLYYIKSIKPQTLVPNNSRVENF